MASNNQEFYRGKRKKTGPSLIITIIVLAVIAFVVLLFYGLQKYIVITNDGLSLELPILADEGETQVDEEGNISRVFETVDAELEIGEPDYSNVKAIAGDNLSELKAVHVPAASVTADGVDRYLSATPDANAVLLDVKTVTGMLVWESNTDIAKGYGANGTVDLKSIVSSLKERDIYVAVRMCCFVDNTIASRYAQLALRTSAGQAYSDANGAWLDPTNALVRGYICDLCRELSKMGVDEIVLLGMRMPDAEGVQFASSSSSSADSTPVTAISGFAISASRNLRSMSAKLSVQVTSQAAMESGVDSVTGQNAELFFKVFDRIYCSAEADSAAGTVSAAERYVELGDINMRLVPMCSGTAPETTSWVLME